MTITEFVESPAYKKIMGKVYGFGAAIVLAGALFKIMHYPGAELMLLIGMGTEIIIFSLSAFEPPHEMPDWSLVYPELVGLESNAAHRGSGGGGGELQALIQSGNIDEKTVAELSEGIKKLSSTSSKLGDLSDASLATQSYLQNIQNASESVGKFGNVQDKTAKVIEESTQALSQSYTATANAISEAGNKVASDMSESGKQLVDSYSSMSSSLQQDMGSITDNNKEYNEQLASLNGNLGSINSIYEMQLKGSKAQVEATENVNTDLGEISDYLKQSVEGAKNYRDQVANLNKTVGELNTIYGNMLSAMNVGSR